MTAGLGTEWAVWAVCGLNGLLFLALLALIPVLLNLRSALWVTERAMADWREAAERALAPTPAELLRLRDRLRENRHTLDRWQRRLQFWQGIRRVAVWLGRRL
ncbi:hypothetical protein SYN63AY4M2_07630 [Synechococcus sp. 63AY4M2]|uniref:hypothetical protein n=1 Tax=Synechococcus sp. 63AY4M2 TaxID=1353266 RepID=UPI000C18C67D|nr:hypothetical protein [Synechococcus sp. 63AY4M2]PIK86322.1 hypothetical protein SYN63AY4M2_07630 [Synechococcus sp. 63AY4M2]